MEELQLELVEQLQDSLQELSESMEEVSNLMQEVDNEEIKEKAFELLKASRTIVSWRFDVRKIYE